MFAHGMTCNDSSILLKVGPSPPKFHAFPLRLARCSAPASDGVDADDTECEALRKAHKRASP